MIITHLGGTTDTIVPVDKFLRIVYSFEERYSKEVQNTSKLINYKYRNRSNIQKRLERYN